MSYLAQREGIDPTHKRRDREMEKMYTTIEDVIKYEVEPALGDFVTQYDVEAIARECWILTDDGVFMQNPQPDFWEVVKRHDITLNWDPVDGSEYRTTDHGGATLVRETTHEGIVYCDGFKVGHSRLCFKARCESGFIMDMVAEAERTLRRLEEGWKPVNCKEPITIEVI